MLIPARVIRLFLLFVIFASSAQAQTISQPAADGFFGNQNMGQSFTATVTGTVTAFAVNTNTARATTVDFYLGPNGSGVVNGVGTPLYSQAITLASTPLGVFEVITLTTPLPVVAGQTYSFVLRDPAGSNLAARLADVYPGGDIIINAATPIAGVDLTFQIFQAAAPPVPPAPVPTDSGWLLGGLAMLMVFAARRIRHFER